MRARSVLLLLKLADKRDSPGCTALRTTPHTTPLPATASFPLQSSSSFGGEEKGERSSALGCLPAAMAAPLLFLLLLAMFTGSDAAFCVCKSDASPAAMQKAIDYACGKGADCAQITSSGACYNPNNIVAHCSYACNSYYQKYASMGATCDFTGVAGITAADPSAGTCKYPASASGVGTGTGTGTGTGVGTGTPGTSTGAGTGAGMGTGTGTGVGTGVGAGTGITPPGSTMPGGALSPPFGAAGAYGPSGSGLSPDYSAALAAVAGHYAATTLVAATVPFLLRLL